MVQELHAIALLEFVVSHPCDKNKNPARAALQQEQRVNA
jgi:hypothetical protein